MFLSRCDGWRYDVGQTVSVMPNLLPRRDLCSAVAKTTCILRENCGNSAWKDSPYDGPPSAESSRCEPKAGKFYFLEEPIRSDCRFKTGIAGTSNNHQSEMRSRRRKREAQPIRNFKRKMPPFTLQCTVGKHSVNIWAGGTGGTMLITPPVRAHGVLFTLLGE